MSQEKAGLPAEKSEAILTHLTGPRGLVAVRDAVKKKIKACEQAKRSLEAQREALGKRLLILQGEIQAHNEALGTVEVLIEESGIGNLAQVVTPAGPPEEEGPPKVGVATMELDEIAQDRVRRCLCLYKSPSGKWCQRRLTSKEEKKNKHCKIHWDALSRGEDPGEVGMPAPQGPPPAEDPPKDPPKAASKAPAKKKAPAKRSRKRK